MYEEIPELQLLINKALSNPSSYSQLFFVSNDGIITGDSIFLSKLQKDGTLQMTLSLKEIEVVERINFLQDRTYYDVARHVYYPIFNMSAKARANYTERQRRNTVKT